MATTFTLTKTSEGRFVFTFKTHDGQVLLTSYRYADKDSALRAISAARSCSRRKESFEILTEEDGQIYFVLKNAREEVLGESQMYPDKESARKVTALMMGKARGARLEYLTDPQIRNRAHRK